MSLTVYSSFLGLNGNSPLHELENHTKIYLSTYIESKRYPQNLVFQQ